MGQYVCVYKRSKVTSSTLTYLSVQGFGVSAATRRNAGCCTSVEKNVTLVCTTPDVGSTYMSAQRQVCVSKPVKSRF